MKFTTTLNYLLSSCLLILTFVGLSSAASADRGRGASLLVFPEFNSFPGNNTILTITNTHLTEAVDVDFIYVNEQDCSINVVTETLTPTDQFSLLSNVHNQQSGRGFVYVVAMRESQPIRFDHLIGVETFIGALGALASTSEPFPFRAGQGLAEGQETDLDGDGLRDFNDLEYELAPNTILFPTFLGQGSGFADTDLILISLTGSAQLDVGIDFLVYNDDSNVFSTQHVFRCWDRTPLSSISGLFNNSFLSVTNNDPNEILGMNNQEAGWMRLAGSFAVGMDQFIESPAFLAALVTSRPGPGGQGGQFVTLPFERGTNANGSLLNSEDPIDGPPGSLRCGGGASCPCGNFAGPLEGGGCTNSTGTGARLDAIGSNQFVQDDLQLVASQAPTTTSGFFLQGGTQVAVPFGDGILCVGTPTRRLQFRSTDASGEAMSTVSLAGFVNPGDTVVYQFWFREPGSGGPCGNPSNFSNAYEVTWN